MADQTAVTRVDQTGDSYRVQGVHEGRPSDFRVAAADVQAIEKAEGRKGVEAFFHRSLGAGRVDQRHSMEP
jgi:transcriptional regulator with AAA-type ATPase domain